ncbi:MAG: hypothetical protein ACXW3Z_14610 [Limisphaerales bacterium]
MKAFSLAAALSISAVLAQDSPPSGEAPPVTINNSNLKSSEVYVYDQKPITGRPVLIAPETAKGLVDRFKDNYARLGSPRMVLYVNRDLVDEASGVKLAERKERVQSNTTEVKSEYKADPNAPQTSTAIPSASNVTIVGDVSGNRNNIPGSGNVNTKTEKSTQENTYRNTEKNAATLADKQTVRDVERLFGRPLRMAGASLADQRVATQLLAGRPLQNLQTEAEQARKDREALGKIADVAVEILISSRQIVVPEVSGDKTYAVPDIQATAIRLSDSRVVGQATASDIIGKDQYAGRIVRNFDVREIAEATALALMEDMLLNIE